MVIQMLEAVSEMLNDDASSAELFMTKVQCAKTLLDKIIEGMNPDTALFQPVEVATPAAPIPPKKHIPPALPEGQYQIEMSADFTIAAIKGNPPLAPDAQIELDGKVVAYKDVIGKAYNTVKIL